MTKTATPTATEEKLIWLSEQGYFEFFPEGKLCRLSSYEISGVMVNMIIMVDNGAGELSNYSVHQQELTQWIGKNCKIDISNMHLRDKLIATNVLGEFGSPVSSSDGRSTAVDLQPIKIGYINGNPIIVPTVYDKKMSMTEKIFYVLYMKKIPVTSTTIVEYILHLEPTINRENANKVIIEKLLGLYRLGRLIKEKTDLWATYTFKKDPEPTKTDTLHDIDKVEDIKNRGNIVTGRIGNQTVVLKKVEDESILRDEKETKAEIQSIVGLVGSGKSFINYKRLSTWGEKLLFVIKEMKADNKLTHLEGITDVVSQYEGRDCKKVVSQNLYKLSGEDGALSKSKDRKKSIFYLYSIKSEADKITAKYSFLNNHVLDVITELPTAEDIVNLVSGLGIRKPENFDSRTMQVKIQMAIHWLQSAGIMTAVQDIAQRIHSWSSTPTDYGKVFRAVTVTVSLMYNQDKLKRKQFLKKWEYSLPKAEVEVKFDTSKAETALKNMRKDVKSLESTTQSRPVLIEVYRDGAPVTTVSGNIKATITACCIRRTNITYEISYFNNGKHETAWVAPTEFTASRDDIRSVGFIQPK